MSNSSSQSSSCSGGDMLPQEEIQRRKESRKWCDEVGFRGCPSPGNPCGQTPGVRKPPHFTVLPHIWNNRASLSTFVRLLSQSSYDPQNP